MLGMNVTTLPRNGGLTSFDKYINHLITTEYVMTSDVHSGLNVTKCLFYDLFGLLWANLAVATIQLSQLDDTIYINTS